MHKKGRGEGKEGELEKFSIFIAKEFVATK
jgi:hypothetical protein